MIHELTTELNESGDNCETFRCAAPLTPLSVRPEFRDILENWQQASSMITVSNGGLDSLHGPLAKLPSDVDKWGELSDVQLALLRKAYLGLSDQHSTFAIPDLDLVLEQVFGQYSERQSCRAAQNWQDWFNRIHEAISLSEPGDLTQEVR
jgi:hypothetical protein